MACINFIRRGLLPLLLLALLSGFVASAHAVGAETTYRDPAGAYRFLLPDGWQASPDGPGVRFTDSADATELMITAMPITGRALSEATRETTASFREEPGYRVSLVGEQDLTVGGESAKGVRFHSNDGDGNPLTTVAVTVVHKDTLYVLHFQFAPEKKRTVGPMVVAILDSWQFV